MVSDHIPDKAALGGIYTALKQAKHSWVFVSACDMPFIDAQVVQFLANMVHNQVDVICPLGEDQYPEPLHSFYHKRCIPVLEQLIRANRLKVTQALNDFKTQYIPFEPLMQVAQSNTFFLNLNTPDDLKKAQTLILNTDDANKI